MKTLFVMVLIRVTCSLYPITCLLHNAKVVIENVSRKGKSSSNESYLWHSQLGHINLDRIDRLVKNGPTSSLDLEPWSECE